MTVEELIKHLHQFPKDLQVAYRCYSEYCLLDADQVEVVHSCGPRGDGWIHDARPDRPTVQYVMFPGN